MKALTVLLLLSFALAQDDKDTTSSDDKSDYEDTGDKDTTESSDDKSSSSSSSVAITWTQYTVGLLNCYAGQAEGQTSYNKVVIYLHGGGGAGSPPGETYQLESGMYGDIEGIKVIYPSSWRSGGIWYETYKNGCTTSQVCGHNESEVEATGAQVAGLINYERNLKGWSDNKNIYLAGYSQGGRVVYQTQFGQLTSALGGCFAMASFPQIPLLGMEDFTTAQAQAAVSYYGSDLNWMMFHGDEDTIFPASDSTALYTSVFEKLGISSSIVYDVTKSDTGHVADASFFYVMMNFVRDGSETTISDYEDFAATLGVFAALFFIGF